ncbi:NRDE-2, necessary for RNA interference-domain-containing protein [Mycena belliarum]|uniref:NRDE-2, necessary for RNA interference-domain-containing protein n=1 Tax=Mycena belliarum TaxID=1033014 RepID=A0AAD6UPU9_9AGAR|nr:NRDE-2, necessary for RNA interference-domain-containing protein [Mycena belliae]
MPPSFASFPALPPVSLPQKEKHRKRKVHATQNDPKDREHRARRRESPQHDPAPQHDAASRLYYSDRKGDPLNITYGGLHSRDVPKYHSSRSVLGLPSSFSALYRTSHGIEVGVPGRRKPTPSLTDASSRTLLSRNPTRSFATATSSSSRYEEHDGFLRLPSRSVKEQSYRSIEKIDANSDSESNSGDSESASDEEEVSPNSHQATLSSINAQLTTDPGSISNWLLLLSHTLMNVPTTSKNATRARSELAISILSRALAAAGGDSYVLRWKYLQAGEEIWHESKLKAEWEDALKNVKGAGIWMEWLEWRIRKSNQGIAGVIEDAKRALGALLRDEIGQLRVFWRLAVAFQNSGFGERATAMFQAQAELTFRLPRTLSGHPLSRRLDSLEEFWESECPRVGEVGATGWESWLSSRHSAPPPSQPKPPPAQDLDPYRKYYFTESLADRTLFLPCRSMDMEADSDPYATILFSDIRDILLNLESRSAKDAFRYAWLTVLGLHLPGFQAVPPVDEHEPDASLNLDDRWCHTYLTRPAYLDAMFPPRSSTSKLVNDAFAGVMVGREREYASGLGGPVSSWGWGVIRPLDTPSSDGRSRALWNQEDLQGVDILFVRNVFSQLRLGSDDLEWDAFALAFEAASSLKSALKLSRALLSTVPDSLGHWAAHARLEQLRGRIADARKVYENVLSTSPPLAVRLGTGQLWWDYAEMSWLAGDNDAALKVVLRCAGVEGVGGVTLLRAKRNLDDTANAEGRAREPWIKLRALLELLTSNEPAQALQIFETHITGQKLGSAQHESLLVAELLMLYRHGTVLKNPAPPSLLRDRAEKGVQLFPNNSVLLGLFLEGEKGQGVWGKVRGILGDRGGMEKDVMRRIEEIWIAGWDKGRWEAEIERTRSGLAAAMESERTRRSPILWRLLIECEIRVRQLGRAKKLLFRAIGDCPLVKEFYLLAFGPLRAVFSAQELNAFADTMAERELRLRCEFDMQGWVEKENGSEDEESSGDEIEAAAKEYRHRLPY